MSSENRVFLDLVGVHKIKVSDNDGYLSVRYFCPMMMGVLFERCA